MTTGIPFGSSMLNRRSEDQFDGSSPALWLYIFTSIVGVCVPWLICKICMSASIARSEQRVTVKSGLFLMYAMARGMMFAGTDGNGRIGCHPANDTGPFVPFPMSPYHGS